MISQAWALDYISSTQLLLAIATPICHTMKEFMNLKWVRTNMALEKIRNEKIPSFLILIFTIPLH